MNNTWTVFSKKSRALSNAGMEIQWKSVAKAELQSVRCYTCLVLLPWTWRIKTMRYTHNTWFDPSECCTMQRKHWSWRLPFQKQLISTITFSNHFPLRSQIKSRVGMPVAHYGDAL